MREHLHFAMIFILAIAMILLGFKLFKWHNRVEIDRDDHSMEPDYSPGKYSLDVQALRVNELKEGSVVAFYPPGVTDLQRVARVVAREGQSVSIEAKKLLVDDQAGVLQLQSPNLRVAKLRVPRGCVFLLANSPGEDSIKYGPIPMKNITGRLK